MPLRNGGSSRSALLSVVDDALKLATEGKGLLSLIVLFAFLF